MAYNLFVDPSLNQRVDDVVNYLEVSLGSPQAAASLLDGISQVYDILETSPESYPYAQDQSLKERGYRRALVGNYLLLFRVERDETSDGEPSGTVYVTHFFHGSQNYFGLV